LHHLGMDMIHIRVIDMDGVGLGPAEGQVDCAKYSSGVPDSLSTTNVRSREELEGSWPGAGIGGMVNCQLSMKGQFSMIIGN
ncbi:MAG: hypothetical protein VCB81_03480, partial [Verrucomicrobiia bacterium]